MPPKRRSRAESRLALTPTRSACRRARTLRRTASGLVRNWEATPARVAPPRAKKTRARTTHLRQTMRHLLANSRLVHRQAGGIVRYPARGVNANRGQKSEVRDQRSEVRTEHS